MRLNRTPVLYGLTFLAGILAMFLLGFVFNQLFMWYAENVVPFDDQGIAAGDNFVTIWTGLVYGFGFAWLTLGLGQLRLARRTKNKLLAAFGVAVAAIVVMKYDTWLGDLEPTLVAGAWYQLFMMFIFGLIYLAAAALLRLRARPNTKPEPLDQRNQLR